MEIIVYFSTSVAQGVFISVQFECIIKEVLVVLVLQAVVVA